MPEHAFLNFPEADRGMEVGTTTDRLIDRSEDGWMASPTASGFIARSAGLRGLHRRLLTLSAADQTCPAASLSLSLPNEQQPPVPAGMHVFSISQVRTAYLPTLHVQRTSQQLPSAARAPDRTRSRPRRVVFCFTRARARLRRPASRSWSCRRCRRGPTCRWDCHACLVPRMRAAVRSSGPVPTARRHRTISSMLRK